MSYIQVDEDSRYNDLFMDVSGKYTFIRYNIVHIQMQMVIQGNRNVIHECRY